MKYSTDRLITVLASVNGTAIDNDGGVSGRYLEEICHAAADRLRELHLVEQKNLALDKRPKSTTHSLPGQIDLSERSDIANYVSDRVFDGKRPLSPELVEKLKAHFVDLPPTCGTPDEYGWSCCGLDPCVRGQKIEHFEIVNIATEPHRDGHPSFLEAYAEDRDW